jgi:protein transport protein SEC23
MTFLDNPEYAHIREMLENPEKSCGEILEQRFPVPKYIKCQQGGSQGRFLLAKVNPSVPKQHQMGAFGSHDDQGVVLTDDVSLKVFMEHLVKLAVQSS